MDNIYQRTIRGFVSSINQSFFDTFSEGFKKTTNKFENIKIVVVNDGVNIPENSIFIDYKQPRGLFGNVVEKDLLRKFLAEQTDIFLYLNDDLWFSEGWLEDIIRKLDEGFLAVSGGIADTNDWNFFNKVIEETKNDLGHEYFIYLVCAAWTPQLFKKIGLPDPYYSGCADDMDWIWRLLLNKAPFCSLRRIRIAHLNGGATQGKHRKEKNIRNNLLHKWFSKSEVVKKYFIEKHGYQAHKETARFMKNNFYYRKFKYLNK